MQATGNSPRVEKQLERLETAKARFDKSFMEIKDRLLSRFDSAYQFVTASDFSIDERNRISQIILKAKNQFEESHEFSRIQFFQPDYMDFVSKLCNSYESLLKEYDSTCKQLPKKHPSIAILEKEIKKYREIVHDYDSMKPGTTWVGYRSDFNWGPVKTLVQKTPYAMAQFETIANPPVNVEFTIRIDERDGNAVVGTITQNNGAFKAIVEGTYDGINLNVVMTRMLNGKERFFSYSGQVVGVMGRLLLRGKKTNGVLTTGVITLQRKN